MRYLHKFSTPTRTFALGLSSDTRSSAIALGKLLADALVIPSSEVDDIEKFYADNCKDKLSDNIFYIIESAVIDLNQVEYYKRLFWMLRYKTLYSKNILVNTGSGFLDFIGISSSISKDELDYIETNSNKLTLLYNGFTKWYQEIDKIVLDNRKPV